MSSDMGLTRESLKERVDSITRRAEELSRDIEELKRQAYREGRDSLREYLADAHTCADDISAAMADVIPAWDEDEEERQT